MKSTDKLRIDQILHSRGLAPSRERAQAMVLAGQVVVNDHRVEKPSQRFAPEEIQIRLKGKDHPFVGRGGVKLAGALENFKIDPTAKVCLDVGASTGGFTDCLLQHGAHKVYTLDSGTHQLADRLRKDPRVVCRENFNARYLKSKDIPELVDLIVVDVSFISLKKIVPALLEAVPPPWELLMLLKPQFEAGKERVEKGGLIRSPETQQEILEEMMQYLTEGGLNVLGARPAVLKGEKGNQEYFIYATHS